MRWSLVLLLASFSIVGCGSPTSISSLGCEWQLGNTFELVEEQSGTKRFANLGLENPISITFGVSKQSEVFRKLNPVAHEKISGFDVVTYEFRPNKGDNALQLVQVRKGDSSILLTAYIVSYTKKMIENCIGHGSTPLLTYLPDV